MKAGSVKYSMKYSTAQALLKDRQGKDKQMRPQDYLVMYVNEQLGLLYNCTEVIVSLD